LVYRGLQLTSLFRVCQPCTASDAAHSLHNKQNELDKSEVNKDSINKLLNIYLGTMSLQLSITGTFVNLPEKASFLSREEPRLAS
jgi:hypothetical protein